jgi:plastocyanin
MLDELWNGILELMAQFVIPDWGALIALLPVGVLTLIIIVLLGTLRRLATAPPARRGKRRIVPRTPPGIHMPGPSFAPIFAAVGVFLLFWGLVVGGPSLIIGAIGLTIGLLYWLREAMVIYDHDVEETAPRLPAVIHSGPPPGVHMPGPSFRPLIASLGMALLFAGLVFGGWILVVGVIALVVGLLGWLADARKEYVKVEEADRTGHLENIPEPRTPSTLIAVFTVLILGAVALQTGLLPPGQASGGDPGGPGASPAPGSTGGPPPSPGDPGTPAPTADVTISAGAISFDQTEFRARADTPFTIAFTNNAPRTPHDIAIHEGSATGPELWRGEVFEGVQTRIYEVPALPAGTYTFICTVHPSMMGTATLE